MLCRLLGQQRHMLEFIVRYGGLVLEYQGDHLVIDNIGLYLIPFPLSVFFVMLLHTERGIWTYFLCTITMHRLFVFVYLFL